MIGVTASKNKSLDGLMDLVAKVTLGKIKSTPLIVCYQKEIEEGISSLVPLLQEKFDGTINSRWLSLKLLEDDESLLKETMLI